MTAAEELEDRQKQWCEQYCKQLVELDISLADSQVEADRQMRILRQMQIDPFQDPDWPGPTEAAATYRLENPIEKLSAPRENVWDRVETAGYFLCVGAIWFPISDWIQGDFHWWVAVDGKFLTAIPFALALLSAVVVVPMVFQRYGVARTVLASCGFVALCTSIAYFPPLIWGENFAAALFQLPFWGVEAAVLTAGVLLVRTSSRLAEQTKQKMLLRDVEWRRGGATEMLNRRWFSDLNLELRNSYHFSSKMVTKAFTELREHLVGLAEYSRVPINAEEEFGPVSDFAYDLARNNHQAVLNTHRFMLITSLFYLLFGIGVTVLGIVSWSASRIIVSIVFAIILGPATTVIYALAAIGNFKRWKQVRDEGI